MLFDLINSIIFYSIIHRFGAIDSFLIPPSKTVGLIEFIEPSEARKAFNGLAYRRYHHVPLYLEWAPLNTITKKQQPNTNPQNPPSKNSLKKIEINTPSTTSNSLESTEESADYSTLYIKNLNFLTTEKDLKNHLINRLGINESEIRTISIPKKQAKNGEPISNKRLSVQEQSLIVSSKNGNKKGNNNNIDKNGDVVDDSNETNKLIVRNVAFQATKEELRSLFSAFGTIKTIRIPRKIGGIHRGFAFVDFNTKQEASRAMNALARTHMYGRHLVIEYAKNDEDINEQEKVSQLRDRADNNVKAIIKSSQNKKRKVGEILDSSQPEVDMM